MEFQQIISEVKSGKFAPIYLLHGDESYYTDKIESTIIEHGLTEMERAFNQTIAYGKDTDHTQLLDALRRYPMMAQRQLVVLREAQDMKGIENLLSYVENPVSSTLFVISYKHGKVKMNTKIGKALKKAALVHEAKSPYDNQMPAWIQGYCKEKGLKLDAPNAALLSEYLGTNLTRTANELDKLALNLAYGTSVSKNDIELYIGISKDYNSFELCKAFAEQDGKKVGRIRDYFAANIRKHNIVPIIATLYAYFSKIYMLHGLQGQSDDALAKTLGLGSTWFLKEYKLAARNYSRNRTEEIIGLLADYDMRSKGVDYNSTTMGEEGLMTELFFQILN